MRHIRFPTGAALLALTFSALAAPPGVAPLRDEHLGYERAFQQDLARRRAEEAKRRAKFDAECATWTPAKQYHALLDEAREHRARAEFSQAIRRYNAAIQVKPSDVEITPEVRGLQATLQAQNVPIEVTFKSDDATYVTVSNHTPLRTFEQLKMKILPGDYEVIGQREGYREVRIPLVLRADAAPPVITVACTQPAAP